MCSMTYCDPNAARRPDFEMNCTASTCPHSAPGLAGLQQLNALIRGQGARCKVCRRGAAAGFQRETSPNPCASHCCSRKLMAIPSESMLTVSHSAGRPSCYAMAAERRPGLAVSQPAGPRRTGPASGQISGTLKTMHDERSARCRLCMGQ